MTALRSLLMELFVEVDDQKLDKFDKNLGGVVDRVKEAGKVFLEAFAVKELGEFFDAQIQMASHVEDLSEKLGISTDALQHFQFAAKSVGVDGESAGHSLGFLNKAVGEALTGSKEAAEAFDHLHVGLKDTAGNAKPVEGVLMDVADALAAMPNQQERAAYAMKLFGREGQTLLPILSQGSEHIREMYGEADELGVILGGDYFKNAKLAREEMEHFNAIIEAFKARLTSAALPAITAVFKWLEKVAKPLQALASHTHGLQHAMELLAAGAAVKLLSTGYSLIKMLGLLDAEFLLPIAAIGLLYLEFDDLMTLMEGGDSVIGDLLEKFTGVKGKDEFVNSLRDSWKSLQDTWQQIKDSGVGDALLAAMPQAFEVLGTAMLGATKSAQVLLTLLTGIKDVAAGIGGLANAMESGSKGDATKAAGHLGDVNRGAGQKLLDSVGLGDLGAGWFGSANGDEPSPVQNGPVNPGVAAGFGLTLPGIPLDHPALAGTPGASSSPSVPGPSGNTTNQITLAPVVQVTVDGGKNPQETGKIVGNRAAEEIKKNRFNSLLATQRP